MRSILALGLLMALAGSANAASVHHRSHAAVRANQGAVASDPRSGFAYAPSGPVMDARARGLVVQQTVLPAAKALVGA